LGRIRINRILEEEIRQVLFVYKLFRSFELKGIKKTFNTLLVLTALLVLLSFLIDFEYVVGGYIVMTATWLIFIFRYILSLRRFLLKKQRLKQISEESFNIDEEYFLAFTDEWIKFETPKIKSEAKWSLFRAYLEEEDTIYLFMDQVNLNWSFSKSEIGDEYLRLIQIAKEKLPPLTF
jgi:hypothetical protein